MRLSQKQVEALWIVEGGNPQKAHEWGAIIMGESGGDTNAHEGGDPNSCCHGLAQLNVEVGNATMKCALNPICATRTSIQLSKNGKDFTPWGAYTNGSYTQYLSTPVDFNPADALKYVAPLYRLFKGEPPLPKFPGEDKLKGAIGLSDGASSLNPFGDIKAITEFFFHASELLLTEKGWVRIGKMLGGSILLLWGLRVLVREGTGSDPVRTGKKLAETAAATAAVVK